MIKKNRNVYQPEYYERFFCIADKCRFTCCRDWTIAVEDEMQKRWQTKEIPIAMKERLFALSQKTSATNTYLGAEDKHYLSDFVSEYEGQNVICLSGQSCPFLNENGLCDLVTAYGDDWISETCQLYPREKRFYQDRVEYSLTLSCQSVVQLLFEEDVFKVVSRKDALKEDDSLTKNQMDCPKLMWSIRDWFLSIASAKEKRPEEALKIIFYLLLDLKARNICSNRGLFSYQELSIDSQLFAMLREGKLDLPEDEKLVEDNELTLDLLIRYYEQKKYMEYVKPIYEDALFLEEMLRNQREKEEVLLSYQTFVRTVYANYEDKIRLLLCEEIWSSLLTSEPTFDLALMKLQWLSIELSVLRHMMFLFWKREGQLSLERLIQLVAVLFRITGYCDDDIMEYLQDCFEELIWDFGYMNLIL